MKCFKNVLKLISQMVAYVLLVVSINEKGHQQWSELNKSQR